MINEFDDQGYRPMEKISMKFDMSRFKVIKEEEHHEYAYYVNLTAKMLFGTKPGKKDPTKLVCKNSFGYMMIHRIFEREQWTLDRIKREYINATKHNGQMSSAVYWWWQRKLVNEKKEAPELG
jgi:hypothetical protein